MGILAKKIVLMSLFSVIFGLLSVPDTWLTPHEQQGDMAAFIGVHWVEFFPSVKLKNGYMWIRERHLSLRRHRAVGHDFAYVVAKSWSDCCKLLLTATENRRRNAGSSC